MLYKSWCTLYFIYIIYTRDSRHDLQLQFCSSPMATFGVVSDGVSCLHPNPLWNGSILLLLLSKLLLDPECLVRRLQIKRLGLGDNIPQTWDQWGSCGRRARVLHTVTYILTILIYLRRFRINSSLFLKKDVNWKSYGSSNLNGKSRCRCSWDSMHERKS